jgi:DnaJ-domain-containing protein 1
VSIGRRLIDLARAELNSLLDRAGSTSSSSSSSSSDDAADPDEDLYRRYGLDELTDEQLEAELERRRRQRETAARAARARVDEAARRAAEGARRASEGPRRPGAGSYRATAPVSGDELRKAYAALEVPYGADFETVRGAYRKMMRKYHPDRQGPSPERQKAANELAQRLTTSYKVIRRHLRK